MAAWIEGRVRGSDVSIENILSASIPVTESGCWLWTKAKTKGGYGSITQHGRVELAHRVSYSVHKGPIPQGAVAMHKCDTRSCVNPDHIQIGTKGENNTDRSRKGRDAEKVTAAQAVMILADSRPQKVIAREYGIHQTTVSNIKTGKRRQASIRRLGELH